eukprot:TRINITY_DN29017_c0_g1_i1.p1 TRINITY_DN29017_c0_g1~~TRINITY_DN29017_c0_g1_i1.p1  ORF type:complete len:491 (-),score=113.30 TRINITY_DN29017_c0_g1_i1:256-1728(-)
MARTRRKKKRTHNLNVRAEAQGAEKVPRSFVISRGKLPPLLKHLERDLRKLMLPHTAINLKDKKNNTLKDFLHVAGPLGVTHFLILSNTEKAAYLRVARCPRGPTLTFEIHDYSLMADIMRSQAHPRAPEYIFKNSPLMVLAGFGSEEQQLKLATVMFQNIFPVIDVNTVKLSSCQRVVLLNYNKETRLIDFRHYSIALQPVGVSRRIRKFVQRRQVPDLRGLDDVSEFITKPNYGSESEVEDEAATVKLANDCGRINRASSQSAVKLHEIGPRMSLKLIKVEEGLCSGGIIFHEYVKKTPEEIKMLNEKKEKQEALRKQRRAEQEANVRRKELAKEASKQQQMNNTLYTKNATEEEKDDSEMDDADWYRQEVGEEPDPEFLSRVKRKEERDNSVSKTKSRRVKGQHLESDKEMGKEKPNTKSNNPSKKRSRRDFERGAVKKDSGKQHKFTKRAKGMSKKRDQGSIAYKILAQKRKTGKGSRDSKKKAGK